MPQKRGSQVHRNVGGRRPDLGGRFFRSKWEANIARWLNHLIVAERVREWQYEPQEFVFSSIKRGTGKFYKPDFKIVYDDGEVVFWEVKGYMDAASKTKLRRMKKFYPEVKVEIVDKAAYEDIQRDACRIIPGWE